MPGTERSFLDPPIRSAVRMITDSAYPRNERERIRRRLRTDDHLNVAELNFVEGELVFIYHDNVQENDYKLPLSVAKVKKVMRKTSQHFGFAIMFFFLNVGMFSRIGRGVAKERVPICFSH